MIDEQIGEHWATLDPGADRRRRMDARVSGWLEARDTPLAAEWLRLFRLQPAAALGLVAVSACSVVASPPILWLVLALG